MSEWSRPAADPENPLSSQTAALASLNGTMVQLFAQTTQNYVNGMASLTREVAEFMSQRLDRNAELGEAMAHCKNLSDMSDLQQDWLHQASEAYLAEMRKLGELSGKLVGESFAPLTKAMNGEADDEEEDETQEAA